MNQMDHQLQEKKKESNWINQKSIWPENNDGVCCIKIENIQLFNRP